MTSVGNVTTVSDSATTMMRTVLRQAKNKWSYQEAENLVRDATSNNSQIPTTTQLKKISQALQYYQSYHKIFNMIWKRLTDLNYKRHVVKALLVLDYLNSLS